MPKRSSTEKIEYYLNKIKRLEKQKNRSSRRIISSDSEDDTNPEETEIGVRQAPDEPGTQTAAQSNNVTPSTTADTSAAEVLPEQATGTEQSSTEEKSNPSDLDPSILAALGEITSESPQLGEKIHDNLAKIWSPLLKKGMTKENREYLLKRYLVPENCTLLQAPTLNPEIVAALTESGKARDKKMATAQQQLGIGITAVNRGLNSLLNNEDKVNAIKTITDGCRILSDLHYQNTETRTKFITPCLDKAFLQVIERPERDNTLFGNNLSEKITASKAIARQSQQIKKTLPTPKPSTSNLQSATRSNYQGNGSGPSRFQPNRGGGRGGYKRIINRAPPPSTQPKMSSKPRAPTKRR